MKTLPIIKSNRKRKPKKDRNILQTLDLRKSGMSLQDIGDIQGVDRQTVALDIARLNKLIPNNTTIESLDKMKVPILKGTMLKLIEGLNSQEKMKDASLNNAAYAFTQIHTALRLEEGKSTSNVSYADSLRALKEAKEELKKLNNFNDAVIKAELEPAEYIIPIVRQS